MRVALSQINPRVCDFEGNYAKIIASIKQSAHRGDRLLVFPELSLSGYLHRDSIEREDFLLQCAHYLQMIVDNASPNVYVVIGTPTFDVNNTHILYNSCVVIHDNAIIHRQAKSALPSYDIFDEMRYYTAASIWGTFDIDGCTCGIAICEDIWHAEHYSTDKLRACGLGCSKLPLQELDMLIVCSASPFETGKLQRRVGMLARYCSTFNFDAVYVNAVGGEDGVLFDGQSFSVNRTGVLTHVSPMYREHYDTVSFDTPQRHITLKQEVCADICKSLVFGLQEYVKKNGFQKIVLGLSGGIDSAVVTVIANMALGADNIHALIMPSMHTSRMSVDDGIALANTLGISYTVHSISTLFNEYRTLLQEVCRGDNADITIQNIQARIRGMIIMAYANATGALPLNTGNKSEVAIGYCTQYGDTIGALAVIGDIYKSQVYELARYINGHQQIIPASIINRPPSAELKPNQTDQDTLPPYDVLDRILYRYIEQGAAAEDIVTDDISVGVVRKVIALHHRSEYKRTQAPPVIRVSAKAFGIGRRMALSRAPFELS